MGVLVDYFAASPQELAKLKLKYGPAPAGWPHVDCKGWLDGLDALAAELTGRDQSVFGDSEQVFGDEESGLTRVAHEVVMALAGVDDARLRSYLTIIVIDNESEPANRCAVATFAATCPTCCRSARQPVSCAPSSTAHWVKPDALRTRSGKTARRSISILTARSSGATDRQ